MASQSLCDLEAHRKEREYQLRQERDTFNRNFHPQARTSGGVELANMATDELMSRLKLLGFVLPLVQVQIRMLPAGHHRDLISALLTQWTALETENRAKPNALHFLYASLLMTDALVRILDRMTADKLGPVTSKVVQSLIREISHRVQ
jgi:hypothetical protein